MNSCALGFEINHQNISEMDYFEEYQNFDKEIYLHLKLQWDCLNTKADMILILKYCKVSDRNTQFSYTFYTFCTIIGYLENIQMYWKKEFEILLINLEKL